MLEIKGFEFSPLAENTYLLFNESKEAVIIDPGCFTQMEFDTLTQYLSAHQLKPTQVWLTHAHFDHVFGLKKVVEKWSITPQMHSLDKPMLDLAGVAAARWNLPFDPYSGPVQYLADGDQLKIGTDVLEVIFAPGHAPGHLCFYSAAQHFVVGGDVLFRDSIGRTDLPGGDHAQLLNSIRKRLFTLPDQTKVYPGHGPYTTIQYEKAHNPFLQ